MLVLTRLKGQKIILEAGALRIVVSINDCKGDKIRIGFDAPQNVRIYREEIYAEVVAENKLAAQLKPGELPPGAVDDQSRFPI